ncbi:MAG: DUF1559 domain-containing protein [Planctomycetaceae bacterium]|nr:DUF1559 domain-containing protein [Planctomycetaceae bacterium]
MDNGNLERNFQVLNMKRLPGINSAPGQFNQPPEGRLGNVQVVVITIASLAAISLCVFLMSFLSVPSSLSSEAKVDARKSQSQDKLKNLVLAMQSYAAYHGSLPPAVVIGPDGKTPHSWRVAIMPYIDSAAAHRKYKFDEPWDSPSNLKILEEMPNALWSPFDDPDSTNSGYYVISGPKAFFDGERKPNMGEIKDGASDTLLIVEAKRDVPWTKPEDIPFDPEGSAPDLGGFLEGEIIMVMADGTALTVLAEKVKPHLKNMIMPNDGNSVPDFEKD